MKIKSLKLKSFRNYDYLDLKFDSGVNLFFGDNAQGKTNILEALYLSGTNKSHRGSKDKEMIMFECGEAHIETLVEKGDYKFNIDMHLRKTGHKGIAVNKVPLKKITELFGIVNMVFFSPEDLNIIKNGPSERRRFIDFELSQLDKIYLSDLYNYTRAINQRNHVLKNEFDIKKLNEALDIWDIHLANYGNKIIVRRNKFISDLQNIISVIHSHITSNKEKIDVNYETCFKENSLSEAIQKSRERDIRTRTTNVGPHRDDICIMINNMDVRKYGSQGQQRTVALSLKLSEIELVKKIIKDVPILLLDDVLSELDAHRRKDLLYSIKGIQTFITCTGMDEYIYNSFPINHAYYVEDGKVTNVINK